MSIHYTGGFDSRTWVWSLSGAATETVFPLLGAGHRRATETVFPLLGAPRRAPTKSWLGSERRPFDDRAYDHTVAQSSRAPFQKFHNRFGVPRVDSLHWWVRLEDLGWSAPCRFTTLVGLPAMRKVSGRLRTNSSFAVRLP